MTKIVETCIVPTPLCQYQVYARFEGERYFHAANAMHPYMTKELARLRCRQLLGTHQDLILDGWFGYVTPFDSFPNAVYYLKEV